MNEGQEFIQCTHQISSLCIRNIHLQYTRVMDWISSQFFSSSRFPIQIEFPSFQVYENTHSQKPTAVSILVNKSQVKHEV